MKLIWIFFYLIKKSSNEKDDSDNHVPKEPKKRPSNGNGNASVNGPTKKDKKDALKNFIPYTYYLKKFSQEESDKKDLTGLNFFNKMRAAFSTLQDKKKLKFIKEAETYYDSFNVSTSIELEVNEPVNKKKFEIQLIFKGWNDIGEVKQPFTSFLSKKEARILFDAYGMPEKVPLSK